MAEVWLGHRRGAGPMEKRIVVKRILRDRVRDPHSMQLFIREAEISMALAHKNIVPTFDFGRAGDELFLVMEYVEGTNLGLALTKAQHLNIPPDPTLGCHIVFEACQALDYAHRYRDHTGTEQCIAHRDVSPANLLLSFSGEVKLTDFGLAAATAGNSEDLGKPRGTPGYMAPEQFAGGFVGPSADLFSLGIILTEAVLARKIRKKNDRKRWGTTPIVLPSFPDSIPKELQRICEKATRFLEKDRYLSARALAKDLDKYLLHARIEESSTLSPMPERLAEWLKTLFPDGPPPPPKNANDITGSAVTFLEHGPSKLVDTNATMRSMDATVADDQSGVPDANASQTNEQLPQQRKRKNNRSPWYSRSSVLIAAGLASSAALLFILTNKSPFPAKEDSSLPPLVNTAVSSTHSPTMDASIPAPLPTSSDAKEKHTSHNSVPHPKTLRSPAPPKVSPPLELRVSSTPWAVVSVLGRTEGCPETPCRLLLPPGTYQLELHNPIIELRKTVKVTLTKSGEIPKHVHAVLQTSPQ